MSSMNIPDLINLLLLKLLVVAEGYVNDPIDLCVWWDPQSNINTKDPIQVHCYHFT